MKNSRPCLRVSSKLRRVPRLGDVFVNRAAVDGGDGGVHVRKSGDEDAQNARAELPGAFQQPDAFFAGHPLVGHQQADFIGVLFEQILKPSCALVAVKMRNSSPNARVKFVSDLSSSST